MENMGKKEKQKFIRKQRAMQQFMEQAKRNQEKLKQKEITGKQKNKKRR